MEAPTAALTCGALHLPIAPPFFFLLIVVSQVDDLQV